MLKSYNIIENFKYEDLFAEILPLNFLILENNGQYIGLELDPHHD